MVSSRRIKHWEASFWGPDDDPTQEDLSEFLLLLDGCLSIPAEVFWKLNPADLVAPDVAFPSCLLAVAFFNTHPAVEQSSAAWHPSMLMPR